MLAKELLLPVPKSQIPRRLRTKHYEIEILQGISSMRQNPSKEILGARMIK